MSRRRGRRRKDFRGYSEFFLKLFRALRINGLDKFFRLLAGRQRTTSLLKVMPADACVRVDAHALREPAGAAQLQEISLKW
jgi:hypothetical protein